MTLEKKLFFRMAFLWAVLLAGNTFAQQMADPDFSTKIAHPAYTDKHPNVAIDEAHFNYHTLDGRYKPLKELLVADGYHMSASTNVFTKQALQGIDVLIIANALTVGLNAGSDGSPPAFTSNECDVVRDWVKDGGSLLLIADHTPFGAAAHDLGVRFGVEMGQGFVLDQAHADGNPTFLIFSAENKLLGDNVITQGREASEHVGKVVAFTGQSLTVPAGAQVLLRLGATAHEAPSRLALAHQQTGNVVGDRAMGLALKFGKGRIAVFGEAAMFSAQVVRTPAGIVKMGMNEPGNDDRQFALNLFHWLSTLLN